MFSVPFLFILLVLSAYKKTLALSPLKLALAPFTITTCNMLLLILWWLLCRFVTAYMDKQTKVLLAERFVSTNDFQKLNSYSNQPYVANGVIGARIPNLGFGFTYDQNSNSNSSMLSNGWPLFNKRYSGAFVGGFYDAQQNTTGNNFPEVLDDGGYESVISSIPQWTDLSFVLDGKVLNPRIVQDEIRGYSQSLNMSNGIVTTSYIWQDKVRLSFEVYAHANISSLGMMKIEMEPLSGDDVDIVMEQFLTIDSCERSQLNDLGEHEDSIFINVSPNNVPYKYALIYTTMRLGGVEHTVSTKANTTHVTQKFEFKLREPLKLYKYSSIVSFDLILAGQNKSDGSYIQSVSLKVIEDALLQGPDVLLSSHLSTWTRNWNDISIDAPSDPFTRISVESSIYNLLANSKSDNEQLASAMSVSGLSSDSYGGLVFWDMDLWMIPALIPISPERAVSAFKYRFFLHEQAKANAQKYGYNGSLYPWTSGGFGNCTSTGPCVDYEYHLNFAITNSIWKLYLSGSIDINFLKQYGWPILKDTADFFVDYVEWNPKLGKYETFNLTDPDEYANFQNNGAYTNSGIAQTLKWTILIADVLNHPVDDRWRHVMENMYFPVSPNEKITLEHDDMTNDIIVKQADVVLISYLDDQDQFLAKNFGYDRQRAINDLIYYAYHQTSQGPAMTLPVYAAVAQKLRDVGCGFMTYLKKSYEPYIRYPFFQMSEQNNDDYDINGGTHPAFPFNTGHAGVIQGFYYGLLGIRFSYVISDSKFDRVLHIDPVRLPLFQNNFQLTGFKYMNESININVNETHLTMNKLSETILNVYIDHRNPIGGLHLFRHRLEIPLYVAKMNFEESITECSASAESLNKGMDGDILDSIMDGDNSTTWQSFDKRERVSVVVNLRKESDFTKGVIIWGRRPANSFSIDKISPFGTINILNETQVIINSPYVFNSPIEIYDRNYTSFKFSEKIQSESIALNIMGVIDEDDNPHGAEIAEFILY